MLKVYHRLFRVIPLFPDKQPQTKKQQRYTDLVLSQFSARFVFPNRFIQQRDVPMCGVNNAFRSRSYCRCIEFKQVRFAH